MAKPTTRATFKNYCLRRLGFPVIDINVDDDQVDDRIDDALQFFEDYHFDGVEEMFLKHQITAADINRGWIYCPNSVIFVTAVFRGLRLSEHPEWPALWQSTRERLPQPSLQQWLRGTLSALGSCD